MSTSLTDKEYCQLTISISKAFTAYEIPVKSKHARAAIIGTHHSNGGHAFWAIAIRQPLNDNRITAWKFCHVLHKILRDGHYLCLQHSMRHRNMITEMGKLWGHLNDGYGLCIKQYTKLLVTKLNFHDRNPRFPGNLVLKRGELDRIAENDINVYFQLAVEMFDYLDDIVALQATIFNSMSKFGVSSMTTAGQCRLAPLVCCIQDSNQLYDFCVRLMFRLHANLPDDLLNGHRERFRTLFKQLNAFYLHAKELQYFVDLIKVPMLPAHPPNFLVQSDLGNYTAPVVVIPQDVEEPESIVENLVDTTTVSSSPPTPVLPPRSQQHTPQPPPLPPIDFDRLIRERDDLIRQLQGEIERQSQVIKDTNYEQRDYEAKVQEHIAKLNSVLVNTQNELSNIRIEKEELELKLQTAPTLELKAQAEEERAKTSEEKFQKLKNMYTSIRDEHIALLRQHGEVSKQLAENSRTASDAKKENEEVKAKLVEIEAEQSKVTVSLQQSSDDRRREIEEMSEKVKILEEEKSSLQDKYQDVEYNRAAEIAELKISLETLQSSLEVMRENSGKLGEEKVKLEQEFQEVLSKKTEIEETYQQTQASLQKLQCQTDQFLESEKGYQQKFESEELVKQEFQEKIENLRGKCKNIEDEKCQQEELYKNKIEEKESIVKELESSIQMVTADKQNLELEKQNRITENNELKNHIEQKTQEFVALESKLNETIQEKSREIADLETKMAENQEKYVQLNANYGRVLSEKETVEMDIQDLLHQQEQLEIKQVEAADKIELLKLEVTNVKIHGETALRALLEACIKSCEKITIRAITESETPGASGTSTYFIMLAEELQDVLTKLKLVHDNYIKDNDNNVEALARKVIVGGHLLASIHEQGMAICNKSTNIESGEKIANEIKDFGPATSRLFESLHSASKSDQVPSQIDDLKDKLYKMTNMIGDLSNNNDQIEKLGDMVEMELSSMDKAITEAAKKIVDMLMQSRASDSGIKLEVNEKILETCTGLMQSIQMLVQKARKVQAEIIAMGKGTASAKEFYKRNHQWTEGLISAAKSVAQGANFLVDAANKAVSGESKHTLDIVVAAQEIAACTAQLVVASRVKAPRNSQNLQELTEASRSVTQSTGAVVATAKDCSQRLEETQDLDLTKLTIHQAKTKEMEVQVRVLELEQALQVERMRLASLRRKNYQAAAE